MKKLMILICLLVTGFSMFACDKEQIEETEKILVKRGEDTEEAAKYNDTGKVAKGNNNPSQPIVLSEVGKYLRAKGCDHNEIREMQKIEKETYGPNLHSINFTGRHFNYADCEGQTHLNCGLYASKRLLHHMGQLGYVSDDLWYRYSDEELRDFVVIVTRNGEVYRNQNEMLTFEAVGLLFVHIGLNIEQLRLISFSGRGMQEIDIKRWESIQNGGKTYSWVRPISKYRA